MAGRDPKREDESYNLGWLSNTFLDSKQQRLDEGELSQRTLNDYHIASKRFADFIGKYREVDFPRRA